MKRPSFQFYPSDWLRDTALRTCSIAARGLWMDMLCYMHEGNPYGFLKVGSKVILPINLAAMCGTTLDEIEGLLSELREAGVFSVNDEGVIFSRRMVKDEKTRAARAAGGKLGGNPTLMKTLKDNSKVNLEDKQKTTPSSSSSSSSSSLDKSKPKEESASIPPQELHPAGAAPRISRTTENDALIDAPASAPNESTSRDSDAAEIYELYPLKVGRASAIKAIKKALTKATKAQLLEAVADYARIRGKAPYTPHASTWFNQERWLDDRATWEPNSNNQNASSNRLEEVIDMSGVDGF